MKQYLLKVWMTAALSLLVVGGVWGQVDYVPNFPVVSEIGESQITLEVQVDQAVSGLFSYYVLLESGETSPSLPEVFSGINIETYEQYPIKGDLKVSDTTNKQTAVISGLNPGTNYSLYVFTRHAFDESIVIEDVNPTRIDFPTVSSPSPVQYVPNFPVVSEIGESQITLEVQVDQAVSGLFSYYVLLESGETSPSLPEVFSGINIETYEQYPIKGDLKVSDTTNKQTAVISGLNPGTNYSLYVFTRHAFDESIVIEDVNPTRIDFSTVSSPSPVQYVPNFPVVSEIGESQISLEVQVDQEVSGLRSYYVLLESGETAPSLIEVFKGYPSGTYEDYPIKGNLNVSNTTNKQTAVISGLNPGTNYSLYVFTRHVEDGSIVIEDVNPTRIDFVMLESADPPYVVTDGYFPAPGTPEISRDTKLRLTFNEKIAFGDLSALFLIHRDGSVRPLLSGSEEVSISVDELELIIDLSESPLTKYNTDYYVLIEPGFVKSKATGADFEGIPLVDSGTISDQVWYFTTETAPPFWEEEHPFIDQQDASKLNLNVLADQTGTVYAVITSNPEAPSAAQIALGQNAVGESALVSVNGNVESIIYPTVLTVDFGTSVPLGTVYFLHTVFKNDDDKYSDVESIAVDRIVPKINEDETYPEDGYSNMGVSEDIVIVFSEHVFGADGLELELTSNSFLLTHLVE